MNNYEGDTAIQTETRTEATHDLIRGSSAEPAEALVVNTGTKSIWGVFATWVLGGSTGLVFVLPWQVIPSSI